MKRIANVRISRTAEDGFLVSGGSLGFYLATAAEYPEYAADEEDAFGFPAHARELDRESFFRRVEAYQRAEEETRMLSIRRQKESIRGIEEE